MPVANVNGQQINYTDSGGEGAAIIWSHGFLMDHTMFNPQISALGDSWRSLAWDERGFGATPVSSPFTYWDSADDAVALLDHLGIEQAVFAGMSQGGYLSLRAALAHPERVRGLILIDTQAGVDPPEVLDGYRGMLHHWTSAEDLDPVTEMVAGLILGTPELSAEWIAKWHEHRSDFSEHASNCLIDRDDITDRVEEIICPSLVIHGDADTAIPIDHGQALAKDLPHGQLAVMPGGSHTANLTNVEETNQAISEFLASLD